MEDRGKGNSISEKADGVRDDWCSTVPGHSIPSDYEGEPFKCATTVALRLLAENGRFSASPNPGPVTIFLGKG